MKKFIALFAASALLFISVATASADAKCNGRPGVIFWQDVDFKGPSVTFCGGTPPAFAFNDGNLSNNTYNLNFGANWNDRISSYKLFNWPAGWASFKLYEHGNYNSQEAGKIVETDPVGSWEWVPNLSIFYGGTGGFDNKASSFNVDYNN